MECTRVLSEELAAIETLDKSDIDCLHKLLLDFFAASYAGYAINKGFAGPVERIVFAAGGAEEASVFLSGQKLPAGKAAFLNAIYAHGAELDDGNKKAMGHAGVHLIPAVFALAEKLGSKKDEVLLALAVGYEAYIRISTAAQPGLVARGYHSTGVVGTLACAAACAKLYGMGAEGIENSIALATTMTGGLLSYGDSRPAIKPLNPAKAAENGVMAAMMAYAGVKGPTEALEGPNGWFHAVTEAYDESDLLRKPGEKLLMHECYFKLYPSCRHTHCGLEAAVNLHEKLEPADIKDVAVHIYPNAIRLAGQIRYPKDQDETKFSIHYTLACALLNGRYGTADMHPETMTEETKAMIDRIRLIPDVSMEVKDKGIRGAKVTVTMKDGNVLEETVLVPKGDPEKPLSFADIQGKLKTCASGQADAATLEKLNEYVTGFSGEALFAYPDFLR